MVLSPLFFDRERKYSLTCGQSTFCVLAVLVRSSVDEYLLDLVVGDLYCNHNHLFKSSKVRVMPHFTRQFSSQPLLNALALMPVDNDWVVSANIVSCVEKKLLRGKTYLRCVVRHWFLLVVVVVLSSTNERTSYAKWSGEFPCRFCRFTSALASRSSFTASGFWYLASRTHTHKTKPNQTNVPSSLGNNKQVILLLVLK